MRKKTLSTICAVGCMALLLTGILLGFIFAWKGEVIDTALYLIGLAVSVILAPVLHETGHIVFAKINEMQLVYAKFFCVRIYQKQGKVKLGFASPFAPDETQVVPKTSHNVKPRACAYTLGGLIFSLIALLIVLSLAVIFTYFGVTQFYLWGAVPYTAYLFVLNALPLEYASGKTDMLVFIGLKNNYPVEQNMLVAMEIQGKLYEGTSYGKISESVFENLPQLAEDEPLFVVMLDIKYRRYIEMQQIDKAVDCLNRLIPAVREYAPLDVAEKIVAEFVYVYTLLGDKVSAEECGKNCRNYLQGDSVTAKRILAQYSYTFGKKEAVAPLKEQAKEALRYEPVKGVAKFEETLLLRIPNDIEQ